MKSRPAVVSGRAVEFRASGGLVSAAAPAKIRYVNRSGNSLVRFGNQTVSNESLLRKISIEKFGFFSQPFFECVIAVFDDCSRISK